MMNLHGRLGSLLSLELGGDQGCAPTTDAFGSTKRKWTINSSKDAPLPLALMSLMGLVACMVNGRIPWTHNLKRFCPQSG